MIISLHIFIAVASLLLVTYAFFKTSNKSIIAGYVSVALTIASGVYLVVAQPARMLHTCMIGVIYITIAAAMLMAARTRMMYLRNNETS